eukprot:16330-Heterococcus_DN1.PRE.2
MLTHKHNSYFSEERHRHALFPTLLAAAYKHSRNRQVVATEVSTELLSDYLQRAAAGEPSSDVKCALAPRFPPALWSEAAAFLA